MDDIVMYDLVELCKFMGMTSSKGISVDHQQPTILTWRHGCNATSQQLPILAFKLAQVKIQF